mgnify:CR=1 FL=1
MKKTEVYIVVDSPKKDNYCTIQLTQGKYTIVDSDDFDLLNRYNWHFQSRGYACNEKLGLLHRFITNCPKGMVVDHINGDNLDNRKENLRICTQTQNTFNSKGVDNKTSKYKGVYWAKIKTKWKAQIHINKKNTYLGLFDSEIDAAKKYDEIAYSLYGDFAKLNFIRYATEEEKDLLEPKKYNKFAELKEAHRNGAVIEFRSKYTNFEWEVTLDPAWGDFSEYRIKTEENPTLTDKDIAIVERLHDALLDNHGYSLESKLLTEARMLANKIKSNIK